MLQKCKACFQQKKKVEEASQGYSVVDFVNDGLVPVWGYACWRPLDPRRQKELANQLKPLNVRIAQRMDKNSLRMAGAGSMIGEGSAPKDSELPLEVVCLVGLWDTEVEGGDARQSFDFNQEASLRVKVKGALNFPPGMEPKDPVELSKAPSKNESEASGDRRWWLKIEVTAVLQAESPLLGHEGFDEGDPENEDTAQENDNSTKLKVKCEKLEIDRKSERTVVDCSDPMVDSWLPVNDILEAIEVMLDSKLQLVIQGLDNKDEVK